MAEYSVFTTSFTYILRCFCSTVKENSQANDPPHCFPVSAVRQLKKGPSPAIMKREFISKKERSHERTHPQIRLQSKPGARTRLCRRRAALYRAERTAGLHQSARRTEQLAARARAEGDVGAPRSSVLQACQPGGCGTRSAAQRDIGARDACGGARALTRCLRLCAGARCGPHELLRRLCRRLRCLR